MKNTWLKALVQSNNYQTLRLISFPYILRLSLVLSIQVPLTYPRSFLSFLLFAHKGIVFRYWLKALTYCRFYVLVTLIVLNRSIQSVERVAP